MTTIRTFNSAKELFDFLDSLSKPEVSEEQARAECKALSAIDEAVTPELQSILKQFLDVGGANPTTFQSEHSFQHYIRAVLRPLYSLISETAIVAQKEEAIVDAASRMDKYIEEVSGELAHDATERCASAHASRIMK